MNEISIQIKYDAFPANFELEDFQGIEEFRDELSKEYIANVKGTPVGRGGLAYELLINTILNISLEDFINMILGGLAYDVVKHGAKSFALKPFFKALEKLNKQNHNGIAIRELHLIFEDSEIIIKSIDERGIYHIVPRVFENIVKVYSEMKNSQTGRYPSKIHIPVIYDAKQTAEGEKVGYRQPIIMDEYLTDLSDENYFQYWGLFYEYIDQPIVYDVINKTLTKNSYWEDHLFETYLLPKIWENWNEEESNP